MSSSVKKKHPISKNALRRMSGAVTLLSGLLVAFSPFSHFKFLSYVLDWPFGLVGLYSTALLLCFWGFCLLFATKKRVRPTVSLVFGLILLFLFAVLLGAYLGNSGSSGAFDFSSFQTAMSEGMAPLNQGGVFGALGTDPRLTGGALGFLVCGGMAKVGSWLPILVMVFVFLLMAFLLFFPAWEKLAKKISAASKLSRAKANRPSPSKEEDRPNDGAWGKEEIPDFLNAEASGPEKEEGLEEEPLPPRPVFVRASQAPVVETRKQYRTAQSGEAQDQEESGLFAPTAFEDSSYFGGGELKRACFPHSFAPQQERVPNEEAGQAKPAPSSPNPAIEEAPSPVAAEVPLSPTVKEETVPAPSSMAEETPVVIGPAFQNPVSKPAASRPSPVPSFAANATAPEPAKVELEEKEEEAPAPLDDFGGVDVPEATALAPYTMPGLDLINPPSAQDQVQAAKMELECQERIAAIDETFKNMGVGAHVVNHTIGPSVTMYEIKPDSSVSVTSIGRYVRDLELRLNGVSVRFSERVLGTTNCALEVPNETKRSVSFYEVFTKLKEGVPLQIPFGVDIRGNIIQGDLAEFPHMLVAGTTGSGKSVFMHGVLCSLIMRNRPEDLKLLLVDPKRVEMGKYRTIPHLLCPVVKEPREALVALKKLVDEMERRYRILEECGVRDIASYNHDYAPENHKARMPYIICVIDEFANLATNYKEVFQPVLDLSGKARSAGIHLIVATQRPDVKIIPGSIKNNITAHVALSVGSTADSMTILGAGGAEDLLGKGDMLVDCSNVSRHGFLRCQGCYLTDHEIKNICDYVSAQQKPHFNPDFLDLNPHDEEEEEEPAREAKPVSKSESEEIPVPFARRAPISEKEYLGVKRYVITQDYISMNRIQNAFQFGYPKAQAMLAKLEEDGIISRSAARNNAKGATVLVHSLDENGNPVSSPSDVLSIDPEVER